MPVKSYLAVPQPGKRQELIKTLENIEGVACESATNKDVIVVVTDTPGEAEDKLLFQQLNELQNIQVLTLVSSFSDQN